MISPESDRPPISPERQAYLNRLNLAKLSIHSWADGILSDPRLRVGPEHSTELSQEAAWAPDNSEYSYRLTRRDVYIADEPKTQYTLIARSILNANNSRYYLLLPGRTTPEECMPNWESLPTQHPTHARNQMLAHLRTSPVDTTRMLTMQEVEDQFDGLVRRYGTVDRWKLRLAERQERRVAKKAGRAAASQTFWEIFGPDTDEGRPAN
ncbi:hypothetical protein EYC59_06520 [Candidatus Saccharibacteria bacterium]|nr:MAG: hypothetical protein EYC59_06520 [Candidatus Saccharibacteria bacterium]